MGAILAGIIQGLGQHAQQQNEQNILAQVKANGDMAKLIEKQAASANTPQDQIELMQLAAKYRALGAKKPSKDMDLHNIFQQKNAAMIQQASQQQQQQNSLQAQQKAAQIQQAQGTVAQGTGLTPPGPDNVQGPAGGMSQGPQVPTGLQGLAPPNPTNAAGAPPPAASAPTPAPQSQAGAPPPVSGLPSPGFNTVAPTNSPSLGPGEFVSPSGDTMGRVLRAPFRTPEQQQEFEARGAGLKQGAIEQAGVQPAIAKTRGQLEAQYELYSKKFKEVTGYVDKLNQNPNSDVEWTVEMGANGLPIAKMDRGVGTGIVSGADVGNLPVIGGGVKRDDATYTLVRYGNGKEKLSPVSPILGQGYTTDASGKQVPVQYNKRVQGSAAAAGIQPTATFNPKLFNLQGGGVGIASPAQIAAGGTPTSVPGAIGTGAPVTSTQTSPGYAPVTTVRTKGGAAGRATTLPAPNPPPSGGGAPVPVTQNVGPAERALPIGLRMQADRVQAGDIPLPAGREGAAIAQIIAERQKNGATNGIPAQMAPWADQLLQKSNTVLDQIASIKSQLEAPGEDGKPLKNNHTRFYFAPDYLKYRLGDDQNLAGLISQLSMASITGAGRILQANGVRTNKPVFEEAQIHTPKVTIDSPAQMYEKLNMMEKNIRDGNTEITKYGRKSGIPQNLNAPAAITPPAAGPVLMKAPTGETMPVPPDQVEHYKSRGAVVVQ